MFCQTGKCINSLKCETNSYVKWIPTAPDNGEDASAKFSKKEVL